MFIESVGYNFKQSADFEIRRPRGLDNYLFIFFTTEVYVNLDNELIKASPNSCIIYEPEYPQLYYNDISGFENDWFHFYDDEVHTFFKLLKLPLNKIFQVTNYNFIRIFIKNLEKEFIGRDLFWEQNIKGLFMSNMVLLAREHNYQITHNINPYKTDMQEKFKAVRLNILTSYEKKWDIEQMALLLSLSRSRFTVLYKEFFQSSPMEDLRNERMNKAKYLLLLNTMSVSSVAYSVGYENIYHFNRQFKKIIGCSPGKYYKNSLSSRG